jgi:hypothetical protein
MNLKHFNSPGIKNPMSKTKLPKRKYYAEVPDLTVALDYLNRPLSAVATGVQAALDPAPGDSFLEGAKRGLQGHGVESWGDLVPACVK